MKIAVTGAGGQLGRALDRVARGGAAAGNVAEGVAAGGDEWIFANSGELDIADAAAVERFFERERPDAVVNCAAYTDVERAETDRAAAFLINAAAEETLARESARRGTLLVHVSTDFVFGGDATHGTVPYKETDPASPLNVYGESKLAGERAVAASGCRGAVVRTSWLYSPWGRNFVKTVMGLAATRDEVRIVADQWGNPTSAVSLAAAIVAMLPRLAVTDAPAELYHFCDAGAVSRADFAAEIVRLSGAECRVVPIASSEFPSAARRPEYSALDTSKITRAFGIAPRPWREPLVECVKTIQYGS